MYDKMPTGTRDNQTEEEREWIKQFLKSEGIDIMPPKSSRMMTANIVRVINPDVKCQSCEDTGKWEFYVDIDSDEISEIPCPDCKPTVERGETTNCPNCYGEDFDWWRLICMDEKCKFVLDQMHCEDTWEKRLEIPNVTK